MGRKLKDVLDGLPVRRRAAIERRADAMVGEMIEASLKEVREAASKTQAQMAAIMGIPQNAVSQLEGRSDPKVSTIARYARALGGELDVVVRVGNEVYSIKPVSDRIWFVEKRAKSRTDPAVRPVVAGRKPMTKGAKRSSVR